MINFQGVEILFDEDTLEWYTESGLRDESLPYIKWKIVSANIKKYEHLQIFFDGHLSIMATPIHIIKETDLRVFAVDKEGNEQGFYKSNSNCKIIKNTRENRDKIRKLRNKVIAADKVMEKARKELYKLQNELGKEFKKL